MLKPRGVLRQRKEKVFSFRAPAFGFLVLALLSGRAPATTPTEPPPTPTPTATPSGVCGNGTVDDTEECDDGNVFGGDGCAANCTLETPVVIELDPGRSRFVLQTRFARIFADETPGLAGRIVLRVGKPGPDGRIPVTLRPEDWEIPPVQTLSACTCLRPMPLPERFGPGNAGAGWIDCGASTLDAFVLAQDHVTQGTCDEEDPETLDRACQESSESPPACNPLSPHPGVCNGPLRTASASTASIGSGVLEAYLSATVLLDREGRPGCEPDPESFAYGPDGLPCTDDDGWIRPPRLVPLTTGSASARIDDADTQPGSAIGPGLRCPEPDGPACLVTASGATFDCGASPSDPGLFARGVAFGLALPILDALDIPAEERRDVSIAFVLATEDAPGPTPLPTFTPSLTRTPSLTPTPSRTPTPRPTGTPTASATPTRTPIPPPSSTPTRTPTARPSPTPSEAPTASPTPPVSPTPSPTPTVTSTPTVTPSPTPLAGDANGDGQIDELDLALLIVEIFDGDGDTVARVRQREPRPLPGVDANGDGLVNAADAPAMIEASST